MNSNWLQIAMSIYILADKNTTDLAYILDDYIQVDSDSVAIESPYNDDIALNYYNVEILKHPIVIICKLLRMPILSMIIICKDTYYSYYKNGRCHNFRIIQLKQLKNDRISGIRYDEDFATKRYNCL